jgi:hypothetical protein
MPQINAQRTLSIPGWFLTMIAAIVPITVAAYLLGGAMKNQTRTVQELSIRMCRVEKALQIQPWPGCPGPNIAAVPDTVPIRAVLGAATHSAAQPWR